MGAGGPEGDVTRSRSAVGDGVPTGRRDRRSAGASPAAVVIAIAPSATERVRLAKLVDDATPLLLVSSAAEARRFLDHHSGGWSQHDDSRQRFADGLSVDSDRHVAVCGDKEVALTPLEHDLLACLLSEPGRVWSFGRLHQAVWGTQHVGAGADVHSVVKRLRRKLRRLGAAVGIDAIRGVGFRLCPSGAGSAVLDPAHRLPAADPAVG